MSCPCDRGRPLGRSLTWLCTESSCLRARLDDGGCKVDPYGDGGAGALRSSRGPWRPGGSYSARRLVPGVLPSARASGARAPANGCEQSYVVACLESEVDRSVCSDRSQRTAKCQETGISALSWLRGLERREGRLPLSSGPRASSPALAGRGAAAGVYHTPECKAQQNPQNRTEQTKAQKQEKHTRTDKALSAEQAADFGMWQQSSAAPAC